MPRRQGWGRGKRTGGTEKEQRAKERADGSKKGKGLKKALLVRKWAEGSKKGKEIRKEERA